MATRRTTRSLREHQSAYEDRAREIQEKIATCREAYRDAKDALGDLRPAADDSTQRKSQLADRLYANILQLRTHLFNHEAAVAEWAELMETYTIAQEDSDWADSMRQQHEDFFALAPTLKAQLKTLLAIYQDYHDRAEHNSADPSRQSRPSPATARPVGSDNASTATTTSQGDNGETDAAIRRPAHPAGDDAQQRDSSPGGSRPAHSAGENDRLDTPPIPVPDAGTTAPPAAPPRPRQRVRIREEPLIDFGDLTLRNEEFDSDHEFYDTTALSPVRTTHPTSYVSSSPYGIFAQSDGGLFTNATPMAFHTTRTGNGQHNEARAPQRAAPVSHAAHPAAGYRAEEVRNYRTNPPPPPMHERPADAAPYAEHRERLRQDLRGAPPAGGGRYSASTFAPQATAPHGPPPAAWTTQPPPSAEYVYSRPPPPRMDHGVDFGRENASKFYQNGGTHRRMTSTKPPPLALKELPIQKFAGDCRVYPMFRNRFLKTVGIREDLDPSDKFQYLLQCLDGEPLRLANGYLITDTNYFKVLDRLEERYGDTATLATLLADDFANLKPVAQTSRDLQRFHDEALRLADQMELLGQEVEGNLFWRRILLSKMPLSLRTKISEDLSNRDPMTAPIREILTRISEYARILRKNEVFFSSNGADGNSDRSGPHRRADPRSTPYRAGTYAAEADTTHAANTRNLRCAYCGNEHWSFMCQKYATVSQRVNRLRDLGFCFLCLRGGHWSASCPKRTNERCSYCHQGQHHQSLCRQALPGSRRPVASLRHSPVRAPQQTSVDTGILKKELPGCSSSHPQADRRPGTPVNRSGTLGGPPATSRPPSTQISSTPGADNSKGNRRGKSKGSRTNPNGRDGTSRPTTVYVDENVTQMDANACGSAGPLPVHPSHLTTDRRSTPAEVRWADWNPGASLGGLLGIPDVSWERGPSDEEASLPESTGHCSDVDTEPPAEEQYADDPSLFAHDNTDYQDYSGYAVSATSPADNRAVLLECLRTTAVNMHNGRTRPVIVFFDNGSNSSYISKELAQDLQLPCLEKRHLRVHTFGTDATTMIAGFATSLLLRSPQGHTVALTATASDRLVPPVTTALITEDEVAQLKRNECSLVSTRETPDLLIGQDLAELFDREYGPKLPNGFRVVWSCLGPMLGGAGKVAHQRRAASTTHAAATSVPEPPSDTTTQPPSTSEKTTSAHDLGYNPEDPLNLWTLDDLDPAPSPAHTADSETETVIDASTYLCTLIESPDADLFGDFSHVENAGIGTSEMTPDDQAAADMLKKIHKRHPDGRYEVPLLFRTPDGEPPSNEDLPTNVPLAKGRSFSTRKMLAPHPKKMLDYNSVIMDWKASVLGTKGRFN